MCLYCAILHIVYYAVAWLFIALFYNNFYCGNRIISTTDVTFRIYYNEIRSILPLLCNQYCGGAYTKKKLIFSMYTFKNRWRRWRSPFDTHRRRLSIFVSWLAPRGVTHWPSGERYILVLGSTVSDRRSWLGWF